MRFMKKVMAFAMAVMLVVPSVTAMATEDVPEISAESEVPASEDEASEEKGSEDVALEEKGSEDVALEEETSGEETSEEKGSEDVALEEETFGEETSEEKGSGDAALEGDVSDEKVTVEEAPEEQKQEETEIFSNDQLLTPPEVDDEASEKPEWTDMDILQFNTGNCVFSLINEEVYSRLDEEGEAAVEALMEAYPDLDLAKTTGFAEDGSYTINIPEENPFFPYEVQFTHKGEKINKWFMSPDDSVEVGGHTFYVNASIDGSAMTRMSLEVAGRTVVMYPEKKDFTNDGDGADPASLIPLPVKELEVDLTGFTPIELTMVSMKAEFEGVGEDVSDGTKIVWKPSGSSDNYTVSGIGDSIDLSCYTYNSGIEWEMILGDGDQLNPDNIRYTVDVKTTASRKWLVPQVYVQDAQGNRASTTLDEYYYRDSYSSNMERPGVSLYRELYMSASRRERDGKDSYLSLSMDKTLFTNSRVQSIKYVEGSYVTAAEAEAALAAHEVTAQVTCSNMAPVSAGYKVEDYDSELTMLAYDDAGKLIGYLPFGLWMSGGSDRVSVRLYDEQNTQLNSWTVYGGNQELVSGLLEPLAVNGKYTLKLSYRKESGSEYPDITSVYVGQYESVAQAAAAGAPEIRDTVCGSGYAADFSQGVYFTVFAGEDKDPNQAVYSFQIKTVRSTPSEPSLERRTDLTFSSQLVDENGGVTRVYIIREQDDSYAEANYITMLVPDTLDLTKRYAPVFYVSDKATVYTAGASSPEISGKSFHLLNQPVQYTVNAENGTATKNYWLQVKKADPANGQLYVNSLTDVDADTKVENGVTYSTREMMLDSYHGKHHDICFANISPNALGELSAELSSDVVELDPYWTLNGKQSLAGMSTIETPSYGSDLDGELPNLAKVRLRAKADVEDGTDISGTLTIRSGKTVLMVLTLTGVIGDPCITTKEIPAAVKYVPYGTVIQNSNKYSWIQVSYRQTDGTLPAGMEIRPNGELYGVPRETGTFEFEVRVSFESTRNSNPFSDRYATLTLTVNENTNDNVYNESDMEDGYVLSTPIGVETAPGNHDFYLAEITDSLFVSEGSFDNFIDLWLNGEKLTAGVDYAAISGSTRITVSAQTMQNKANSTGNNTIAAEFRENKDLNNELRRTAQNFHLDDNGSGNGGSGGSGSGSGRGGSSGGSGNDGGNGGGATVASAGVTIRGYLVDTNNQAVSGMAVELHSTPRTTVTNANGRFEFAGVEYGSHQLFVKDAAGNVLASTGFELVEGSTTGLSGTVLTAPAGFVISMTVKMADGGLTLSDVLYVSSAATEDSQEPAGWMLLILLSVATLAFFYKKRLKLS